MKNVLVTFGSKCGSTAEIAEKIGEVLQAQGLTVSVMPAAQVKDLNAFNAVVLGSAVYAGHWMNEAVDFLVRQEVPLSTRPVWLFSSGPTGQGDPVERLYGWRFPDAQLDIADRIRPQGMMLFHGKIDINKLNFGEKLMIRAIGAPTGDFRDWEAIIAWAEGIATVLLPLEMTVGSGS